MLLKKLISLPETKNKIFNYEDVLFDPLIHLMSATVISGTHFTN